MTTTTKNASIIGYKNHLFGKENWTRDMENMIARVSSGRPFRYVSHFQDSLVKRGLTLNDVLSVFTNGTAKVIQGHAVGTFPFSFRNVNEDELRVVYGKLSSGKVIHIVVAISNMKLVTVYEPSQNFFESDNMTLRSRYCFKPIFAF